MSSLLSEGGGGQQSTEFWSSGGHETIGDAVDVFAGTWQAAIGAGQSLPEPQIAPTRDCVAVAIQRQEERAIRFPDS
jgi:hypothetical protein